MKPYFSHAILMGTAGIGLSIKIKPQLEIIVLIGDHYFEVGIGAK